MFCVYCTLLLFHEKNMFFFLPEDISNFFLKIFFNLNLFFIQYF